MGEPFVLQIEADDDDEEEEDNDADEDNDDVYIPKAITHLYVGKQCSSKLIIYY